MSVGRPTAVRGAWRRGVRAHTSYIRLQPETRSKTVNGERRRRRYMGSGVHWGRAAPPVLRNDSASAQPAAPQVPYVARRDTIPYRPGMLATTQGTRGVYGTDFNFMRLWQSGSVWRPAPHPSTPRRRKLGRRTRHRAGILPRGGKQREGRGPAGCGMARVQACCGRPRRAFALTVTIQLLGTAGLHLQ